MAIQKGTCRQAFFACEEHARKKKKNRVEERGLRFPERERGDDDKPQADLTNTGEKARVKKTRLEQKREMTL